MGLGESDRLFSVILLGIHQFIFNIIFASPSRIKFCEWIECINTLVVLHYISITREPECEKSWRGVLEMALKITDFSVYAVRFCSIRQKEQSRMYCCYDCNDQKPNISTLGLINMAMHWLRCRFLVAYLGKGQNTYLFHACF